MTRLVLASASPRRRALLRAAGRPPDEVVPADVDETPRPDEDATALAARLAAAKRDAVAARLAADGTPDAVVLAADTVVAHAAGLLGKPRDDEEAATMLRLLSGSRVRVSTGVAVAGPAARPLATVVTTTVGFRELDEEDVAAYVATGEPRGVAGAFRLQGGGAALVATTDGCPSNVVGLPTCAVRRLVAAHGVTVPVVPCDELVARVGDRASGSTDRDP